MSPNPGICGIDAAAATGPWDMRGAERLRAVLRADEVLEGAAAAFLAMMRSFRRE